MPGQDPNYATPSGKQTSPVKPRVPCGEAVSDPWIPESKLPPIPKTTTTPDSEFEMPYSAAIPPYPTHERQREIRQQAKDQVEQDRQAAIRASLIRAGQNVSSGPKIPKPEASVPPHDFKQEKKEENREEKTAATPQRREVAPQTREAAPQRLPSRRAFRRLGIPKAVSSIRNHHSVPRMQLRRSERMQPTACPERSRRGASRG